MITCHIRVVNLQTNTIFISHFIGFLTKDSQVIMLKILHHIEKFKIF